MGNRCLILGNDENPNICWLYKRIVELGKESDFLIVSLSPKKTDTMVLDEECNLTFNGRKLIPPTHVWSYFYYPPEYSSEDKEKVISERTLLEGWAEINGVDFVNCSVSLNKIVQLQQAKSCGFHIPKTIVRSNPQPDETKIEKLPQGCRWTNICGQSKDNCVKIVQNRILGEELRAYIVGDSVVCGVIKTNEIDYREKSSVDCQYVALPKELEAPFKQFIRKHKIVWGNIDLKFDNSTGWNFLEYNRWPFFARQDFNLDGKISEALINFLSSGANHGRAR